MVQVIQELPQPLTGMKAFAAGLGSGIGQGIADFSRMTIADKMDALKQQRQLQMAQQAQETMASKMQALGMPMAAQLTRAGFQPQHLEKLAVEYPEFGQELMRGMAVTGKEEAPYSPLDSLRQQQESVIAKNALLQPQDREAIPTEIESVQTSRKTAEEPKTLDEFRRRLAPNYDRLSLSAKAKIDQRAEREFNAATAMRKEELGREKFEYEKGAPAREYVKEAQTKLMGWQKQKPIFKYMAENAKNISELARYKSGLAKLLGIDPTLALKDPEQVMNKMSYQVLQGIGSVFPGRILATELDTYMRANPNIMNSPKALEQIANIVLENGKLIENEYKTIKDLRKKYSDREDLFDAVQEKMQPEYDSINNKINKITSGEWRTDKGQTVRVQSPDGKTGTIPLNQLEEAIKQGYKSL